MARRTFEIVRVGDRVPTYDVRCLIEGCGYENRAWDYRQNAMAVGYKHFGVAHVYFGEPVHYAKHCDNPELRTTDTTEARVF